MNLADRGSGQRDGGKGCEQIGPAGAKFGGEDLLG